MTTEAFDFFQHAREVAAGLRAEGHAEIAEQIIFSMEAGSTGTEILMALRWHVEGFLQKKPLLSARMADQTERLIRQLNKSLDPVS